MQIFTTHASTSTHRARPTRHVGKRLVASAAAAALAGLGIVSAAHGAPDEFLGLPDHTPGDCVEDARAFGDGDDTTDGHATGATSLDCEEIAITAPDEIAITDPDVADHGEIEPLPEPQEPDPVGDRAPSDPEPIQGFTSGDDVDLSHSAVTLQAVPPAEPISIPDDRLRECAENELANAGIGYVPGDPITAADAASLTRFTCNWTLTELDQVSNLDGLEHFTNLTTLHLQHNNFGQEEFNKLSHFTGLEALGVPNNAITDISFLENFTSLEVLFVHGNDLESLEPIRGLTLLTSLQIGDTNTPDLGPLEDLVNLEYLNANNLDLSGDDLSALSNLTNLERVWLVNSGLTSVDGLAPLTQLTTLRIGGNHIVDLSPLSGLTNLTNFNVANQTLALGDVVAGEPVLNPITDLDGEPVALDHPSYDPGSHTFTPTGTGLDTATWDNGDDFAGVISFNATPAVEDIDIPDPALLECINAHVGQGATDTITTAQAATIMSLYCEDMGIVDLTGIDNLTNLSYLVLPDNEIVDVTPLASVGPLATGVNLSGNRIEDVSALSTLQYGEVLDLSRNHITDVSALSSWFNAHDQVVDLGDLTVGEAQENPVVDARGAAVPLSSLYDAGTNTFTPANVGAAQVEWVGPDGQFGVLFTGTLLFNAVGEDEVPPVDPPVDPVDPPVDPPVGPVEPPVDPVDPPVDPVEPPAGPGITADSAPAPGQQLATTGAPSMVLPLGAAALLMVVGLTLAWITRRHTAYMTR